jgi:hypothetical protein
MRTLGRTIHPTTLQILMFRLEARAREQSRGYIFTQVGELTISAVAEVRESVGRNALPC